MKILCTVLISLSTIFSQTSEEQSFKLKDGTVIIGTILEDNDQTIIVQSKFGEVTIYKRELLRVQYEVVLNSGEKLIGFKSEENAESINLQTQLGELIIQKSDIKNIQELGKITETEPEISQPIVQYRRPYSLMDFLFSGKRLDKDTEFAIGEEQLIDLFFDPTGYTLEQSTMYLSGLSFGFGVTDKIQVTTKWGSFFWGNMNIRPKLQVFEKGNWEKQSSLSVGLHYHTRWRPNKYEWKIGEVERIEFTGEWGFFGLENCPDGNSDCWKQTAEADTVTKYWGDFYRIGENPRYSSTIEYDEPDEYHPDSIDVYYAYEPSEYYDDSYYNNDGEELVEMLEIFGAYTFSKAREGLRGRISHTIGGHVQYAMTEDDPKVLYRAYYGLDVDINPKLKMIGEVFYDPNYVELWQRGMFDFGDELHDKPVEKEDFNPVHIDFGFIYSLNETFRFGIHFQQPWVAFYWKF